MRIQHKPGNAIQVDWAGDSIPIYDSVTGQQSSAYLFVAVLPDSVIPLFRDTLKNCSIFENCYKSEIS